VTDPDVEGRLRHAAALIRDRANAARAGRWEAAGSDVAARWQTGPRPVALCVGSLPEGNVINAEHVASWDPAVALEVADLLVTAADWKAAYPWSPAPWVRAATRIADTYLGDDQT
jgi:hypothetical protein